MPFKSDAQRRYLYAEKPDVARKFAEHDGEDDSVVGRAFRSLKDFVSGESANRRERERQKPPSGSTGIRG